MSSLSLDISKEKLDDNTSAKLKKTFMLWGQSPTWLFIRKQLYQELPCAHSLSSPMTTTCLIVVNTYDSICLTLKILFSCKRHLRLNHVYRKPHPPGWSWQTSGGHLALAWISKVEIWVLWVDCLLTCSQSITGGCSAKKYRNNADWANPKFQALF